MESFCAGITIWHNYQNMGLLWEEEGSQSNTADILQTLLNYLVLPFYRIIKTLFKTLLWEECSQSNNAAILQTLLNYLVLLLNRIIKTLLWEECSQSNNAAILQTRHFPHEWEARSYKQPSTPPWLNNYSTMRIIIRIIWQPPWLKTDIQQLPLKS